MEIVKFDKNNIQEIIKRSQTNLNDVTDIVLEILDDVKKNQDEALFKYNEKFDGAKLDVLQVSHDEIQESYQRLDKKLIDSIKKAKENISQFHKKQVPHEWYQEKDGIQLGQIIRPLNSVGCYIPGGRAPYPSTILMVVTPAKIAGVEKVVCCTPPQADGKVMDAILVAADIAGADEIYKVGGAQAIAALAYGTESIEAVDKIVGPGNIFVTAAKKLVYGDVDIEFPAGPSEVLIIADSDANPEFITYDLLAQAEHDPNASCFLVTDDEELAKKVSELLDKTIPTTSRKEIIKESIDNNGKIIITQSLEESIYVSNEYAPEHLIIMTRDPDTVLKDINNAGSIFLGELTPVSAGDYGSGTNHVLPTSGGARMYSGISTETFIKKPTVQKINKEGLESLKDIVVPLAEYEQFTSHANSLKIRLKK